MAKQQSAHAQESFTRFSVPQRIEHIVLLLSFSLLGITGLAQKFLGNPVAEGIIALLGGIEATRVVHRIAALVFALQSIYHITVLAHKVFVKRFELSMLPGLRDVTDAIDVVRYNLGLTRHHPKLPRYNFAEKAEYWALIWGGVVMGITGFMLWNPILTARFLPGHIIPAAKAAHGAEAILAVLAIFVWHFYSVHVKMFNKSMFTGKLTRHQMEEEHGEELEQHLTGRTRPPADPDAVRRRERIFVPLTIVAGLLLAVGVIWFATFEETAIATLPEPVAPVVAFVPLTPTPVPVSTAENNELGSAVPHPVEGDPYQNCATCHGLDGMKPFPVNHAGRPVESCLICHKQGPAAEAGGASEIPHPVTGDLYQECATCHGVDKMRPFPANHVTFTNESCTMCHQPAEGSGATGGSAAGAIPHPVTTDAYRECAACHGVDKVKPFPSNHVTFTNESCTGCHEPTAAPAPAVTRTPGQAGSIPHPIEGDAYKDCNTCHGPGAIKPGPENHANFPLPSCTACHLPQQ